jgi:peptidoglycan hydrolase-like protein with peptidoglycan-binding domain
MKRFIVCLLALVLALYITVPSYAQNDESLAVGSRGDAVHRLQSRLTALGFLDDKIDGIYGQKTEAAVKAFHAFLLEKACQDTAAASGRSISAEDLKALYTEPFSFYLSDLKSGDVSDAVTRLQQSLIRLNYMDGAADGIFSVYTREAVKLFQTANGLPLTGIADQATQDLLTSGGGKPSARPAYRALRSGDSGETVRILQQHLIDLGLLLAPADGYLGSDTIQALSQLEQHLAALEQPLEMQDGAASIELQQKLDEGVSPYVATLSVGADALRDVRRLQRRLNALGYLNRLTIDGKYGSSTQDAVSRFQAENNLEPTGEADEKTQRLLFSADAVGRLTPYRLRISLADQRVYVYKLMPNNQYEWIRSFICSTGLGDSTPRGVFTNTGPGNRWHYFKKFMCWAQYAYYIEGDIMFHSVIYSAQNENTLRYSSLFMLGRKASHGCVRLNVKDARWIYQNCKKGTVITIY